MLALVTYSLFTSYEVIVLYRIMGAGYCSIIGIRALQSLQFNNRQLARVFLCPVHNHSRELFSPS